MFKIIHKHLVKNCLLLASAMLSGCSIGPSIFEEQDGGPDHHVDVSNIQNAVPRDEPRSRYGNPSSYEVLGKRYHVMSSADNFSERGIASWYGNKFHGRRTSSGEPYDMYAMTAAHKSLPLPTYVEVTNLENNRQIIVKVNDRGPFHQNRIIDLSYVAAAKLGITAKGTGLVEIRAINPSKPYVAAKPARTNYAKGNNSPSLFIQAGAFGVYDNALRMKARLESTLHEPVRINQVSIDGKTIYRVQVGPLLEVQVADNISFRLADLGIRNLKTIID